MAVVDPVIVDVERKLREVIDALDHKLSASDNFAPEGTAGQVLTSRGEGLAPAYTDVSVGGGSEFVLPSNIAYLDKAGQVFRNEISFSEPINVDTIDEYNGGAGVRIAGVLTIAAALITATVGLDVTGASTFRSQFTSTVVTGSAPFVVASTTKVLNLNVDLLDGRDESAFAGIGDAETVTGLWTFSRGVAAPFAVAAGALNVVNLDADLLDGQHGAFYQDAGNLNAGVAARARLPAAIAYEDEANTFSLLNTFGAGLTVSASGINVTGTSTFNASAVSMGALTASGRVAVTGAVASPLANALLLANNGSGQSQIWALGPDTTTQGTLALIISPSNLSNSITVLTFAETGAASFGANPVSMGALTATTVVASGRAQIGNSVLQDSSATSADNLIVGVLGSGSAGIAIGSSITGLGALAFLDDTTSIAARFLYGHTNNELDLEIGGAVRARWSANALLLGTTTPATGSPRLDVVGNAHGAPQFVGAHVATGGVDKSFNIGVRDRADAEEPWHLIGGYGSSTQHILNIGGLAEGTVAMNAATVIRFYTAANTTTLGGTLAADITGVGPTALWYVRGDAKVDRQLISLVATGTAPLSVASTTLVTNLNADLLDGSHASAFATAAHTHPETDIVDGTILARVGAGETITGGWTFDNTLTMAAGRLLLTAASAAGGAGFRVPHGTAPTTPTDGDVWTTTGGLFARISGVTKGPYSDVAGVGGSGTTNTIARFTAGTTIGNSGITDDGSEIDLTGSRHLHIVGGVMGIGVAPTTIVALQIQPTYLTGINQVGMIVDPTINSAATNLGEAIQARVRTAAASFTVASVETVSIRDAVLGAGSAITNLYGLKIENITKGSTNYAIYTGTGKVRFGDDVQVISGVIDTATAADLLLKRNGVEVARATSGYFDATLGLKIAGGTEIVGLLSATVTWNPTTLSAHSGTTTTVTVIGAVVGNIAWCDNPHGADGGPVVTAAVTSADTVTLYMFNADNISVDPASRTIRVVVMKF